jgi:ABC-type sulfate transport system permease component
VKSRAGAGLRLWKRRWVAAATAACAALLVALLTLPTLSLFVTAGPRELLAGLRHPVAVPALLLSLVTTAISLALVLALGTPLAWWLSRARGRGARVVETLVALPVVIPPAVAGIALLLTFGRRGLLGPALESLGWGVSFSTAAVVLAQVFVSAPFYLQGAAATFRSLDPACCGWRAVWAPRRPGRSCASPCRCRAAACWRRRAWPGRGRWASSGPP